jgi:integrase
MAGRVEHLADGRLRVSWVHPTDTTPSGKRRQYRFTQFVDEDDAEDFRDWIIKEGERFRPGDREIRQGVWRGNALVTEDRGMTFKKFTDDEIESKDDDEASAYTKKKYKADRDRYCPDWLKLPMATITQKMVKAKSKALYATYAPKTAAGFMMTLAGYFAAARDQGVIDHNPFKRHGKNPKKVKLKDPNSLPRGRMVDGKLVSKSEESVFLPPAEFIKIHDAALMVDAKAWPFAAKHGAVKMRHPQTLMVLRTFMATALRINELLAMQVKHADVFGDPENSYIRLRQQWKFDEKGGRYLGPLKGRAGGESGPRIPLHESFARELRGYILSLGLDPSVDGELFVFAAPRSRGKKAWWSSAWRTQRWHPAVDLAHTQFGLPKHIQPVPHSLRHGYASTMLGNGASAYAVSVILRHQRTTTTTGTYGHEDRQLFDQVRAHAAEFLPLPALTQE